jgi:hypothetical protein
MVIFLRIIGALISLSFLAIDILLWVAFGVPVNALDWAACIIANLMNFMIILFGVAVVYYAED